MFAADQASTLQQKQQNKRNVQLEYRRMKKKMSPQFESHRATTHLSFRFFSGNIQVLRYSPHRTNPRQHQQSVALLTKQCNWYY